MNYMSSGKVILRKVNSKLFCRSFCKMKSWSQDNIEMYSTQNGGKSVIAERFMRILKNKIYFYKTSVSKIVCIDKLDDIVHAYNNTYDTAIRLKPNDVKSGTYIKFVVEIMRKIRNVKLVPMREQENIKSFL